MKVNQPKPDAKGRGWFVPVLLLVILIILFCKSFLPEYVHFNNDGPLGPQSAAWVRLPAALTGMWVDLNDVGFSSGTYSLSISAILKWLLGPVGFSKFLAPTALFILGLGAWTFFRQLKLSPVAVTLGALATMLNSTYFATACWGVASQQIAIGMDFFAMALIVSNTKETSLLTRWVRFALAGLAVGVNVIEAADVGALFSIFISVFVLVWALVFEEAPVLTSLARGVGRVAIIAIFAGFIAAQAVVSLIGSSIVGVAGTGQDSETKAERWDWATQWSEPKKETLGLFIPGLFGYKLDTPKNMAGWLQDSYKGGNYWGGVGRDPAIDRYFDSGQTGSPPPGFMRFTGGGNYCGIFVFLVAAWTIGQAFRRQNSVFAESQRRYIWFWTAMLVVSLLLSYGRFAPFYKILYALPYFSTIRNPTKFLIFFSLAIIILFTYGIHGLCRRYLDAIAPNQASSISTQLKSWWAKVRGFDRNWTSFSVLAVLISALGWLIYATQKQNLIKNIQTVGFDTEMAKEIASFSIGQVGWFVLIFGLAVVLCVLVIAGIFSGKRAKIGGALLGILLVMDLGRADLPYIIHWDYKQKYDIDPTNSSNSINPIINFLRDKSYEHRVAGLPFDAQQQLRLYDNWFGGSGVYRIEWVQHHFPYYNIQSLDIIQMPRVPENLKAYWDAFAPHGTSESVQLVARHWELTNTRYLLGAAGFLEALNQQLDPVQRRFRIAQRFDIVPKPGVTRPTSLEELTAQVNDEGDLALFEFAGALPRVKLYSNWQVNTNDQAVLKTLADLNFDPAKTVLISTPQPDLPAVATNENSGTVEFKSYAPKDIVFTAHAVLPSVLLLNDKYDPNWRVTVDGKRAELLRCNYIMRGVYLAPGEHTVEFQFSLPNVPMYITLAGIVVGVLLSGFLLFTTSRKTS